MDKLKNAAFVVAAFVLIGVIGLRIGATIENEKHKIGADGTTSQTCDPREFVPGAEDSPCWAIQSVNSDYKMPFWAIWADDYRL